MRSYPVPIYRQTFDEPLAHIGWSDRVSKKLMDQDGVAYIECPECNGTTLFELPDGEKVRCNECKGRGRICANLF